MNVSIAPLEIEETLLMKRLQRERQKKKEKEEKEGEEEQEEEEEEGKEEDEEMWRGKNTPIKEENYALYYW